MNLQPLVIIAFAAPAMSAQTPAQSPEKEIDIRIAQINSQLADIKRDADALEKALSKACAEFYPADDAADVSKQSDFIQSGSVRQREMESLARSLRQERVTLELKKKLLIAAPVCRALFLSTIDKKSIDLTVLENRLDQRLQAAGSLRYIMLSPNPRLPIRKCPLRRVEYLGAKAGHDCDYDA
jgi:hypothetical protein